LIVAIKNEDVIMGQLAAVWRKIARNKNVGEKPAMKFATEYQRIEIINGILRPTRSASHPEATAPTSRSHKVIVKRKATSVIGTPNSWEMARANTAIRDTAED
jgi:hypothetical protein